MEAAAGQPCDHEVAGLDIAVNQIPVLCRDESFLTLESDLSEIGNCQDTTLDHLIDGFSGEKFHDDVRAIFVHASVEDGDNIGVLQRAERGSFVEHGFGSLIKSVIALKREDSLQGHFPI